MKALISIPVLMATTDPGEALMAISSGKFDSIGIVGIASMGIIFGLFWGLIGAFLGSFKNRKTLGLFLGMVLGIVGLIPLLFAKDGTRDEGLSDMFMALIMSAVVNVAVVSVLWFTFTKPILVGIAEEAKRADEAHAEQIAAINADATYPPAPSEQVYDSTAAADFIAAEPEPMPTPTPKPKPTPSSVTWSAFPPGVDTPEQKREYLQRLADEKRQRQQAAGVQR
jgi:hypothetical protein